MAPPFLLPPLTFGFRQLANCSLDEAACDPVKWTPFVRQPEPRLKV